MNLLFVTGIFPPDHGGPASYVPRMAAALAQRGHRVEVICLSDRLDHDDSTFSFRVQRIRRGIFWPVRVLLTAFAIWGAARRNDLVYVNGLGAESALGAALAGRPTVHKIVGDYAWERATNRGWFRDTLDAYQTSRKGLALRLLDAIRTLPLRLATAIIVPSKYLHRIVAGWEIPTDIICTIPNAVAQGNEEANKAASLPPWEGKTLITVGRLVPWKGIDAIIRLLPELPTTRLVVAGDGLLRNELASLAQACGVAPRVHFLGDVPHSAVRGYLQQADAFVLNSSYEGLPHVVLEAMSAGVPVIATDAGGTHEVVEDGITGKLIPVGNSTALRRAVEQLWQEPGFAAALVAEATACLNARFSFQGMIDATEAALLSAVPVTRTAPTPAWAESP